MGKNIIREIQDISFSNELKKDSKKLLKSDLKKRIYIAYGSNMDICRMDKRTRDFEFFGTGCIFNYKLTFQQSISGFYANLIPNKSKKNFEYVPVVLYLISEEDEENLDIYEGYPQAYRKSELEVEMDDGSKVKGLAYLLPLSRSHGIPTFQYYRLISNAYKIFGFDLEVLKSALAYSYKRARTALNAKVNNSIKRFFPKKDSQSLKLDLTNAQKKFIQEFNDKNNSDWELREAGGYMVLVKIDSKDKSKNKTFEVILNKNNSISLKDINTDTVTTLEDVDSLIKCCNSVK